MEDIKTSFATQLQSIDGGSRDAEERAARAEAEVQELRMQLKMVKEASAANESGKEQDGSVKMLKMQLQKAEIDKKSLQQQVSAHAHSHRLHCTLDPNPTPRSVPGFRLTRLPLASVAGREQDERKRVADQHVRRTARRAGADEGEMSLTRFSETECGVHGEHVGCSATRELTTGRVCIAGAGASHDTSLPCLDTDGPLPPCSQLTDTNTFV